MVPDVAVVVHINIRVRLPDTVADQQVKETAEPAETDGVLPVIETPVT